MLKVHPTRHTTHPAARTRTRAAILAPQSPRGLTPQARGPSSHPHRHGRLSPPAASTPGGLMPTPMLMPSIPRSGIATFIFVRYHSYGSYKYCPASETRPPHCFPQPCTVSTLVPASITEIQQSTTADTIEQLRWYKKTRPREVTLPHVCSLLHIRIRRNFQWVRHDKAKEFLTIRLSYRTRCPGNVLLDRCHQRL
jgi:hypothetical protein